MKTNWRMVKVFGRPWQDLLFAAGEVVFLTSLIPLFFANANVPLFTGVTTGGMLYAFAIAQVSYRNWLTVALTLVTGTLWILIGVGISL